MKKTDIQGGKYYYTGSFVAKWTDGVKISKEVALHASAFTAEELEKFIKRKKYRLNRDITLILVNYEME